MTAKKKALSVEDFGVETFDNARAVVSLGDERTEPLTQADLFRIVKALNKAIQETY